jgi:hypothetical protein
MEALTEALFRFKPLNWKYAHPGSCKSNTRGASRNAKNKLKWGNKITT